MFCLCHNRFIGSWYFLGYVRTPNSCCVVGGFAQVFAVLFVLLSWLVCCSCWFLKILFSRVLEDTFQLLWCWRFLSNLCCSVCAVIMIGVLFVLEDFVLWGHLPVVLLLEVSLKRLLFCLCLIHDWWVVCVGPWRLCFVRTPTSVLLCEIVHSCVVCSWRLCFVRTPTGCCLLCLCWWWFRTAVCVFVMFVWVGAGPVLVISAPGPRAPHNIFNPTRYTRLGIKCSSGLNSYARMPDNQQLKPLWRTAYYPHYRFIILLPTYYQSVCNGVISVGSDICLLFHCCS